MKLCITIFFFLVSYSFSYSQNWHNTSDTLKLPASKWQTQVAMSYNNRFDTVECRYKLSGSGEVKRGYKYVFILEGFYIDTPTTVNVFFDERRQRISGVQKFYFN